MITLVVWTVVAATTDARANVRPVYDWRPMVTFDEPYQPKAEEACHEAARQLDAKKYVCLKGRR